MLRGNVARAASATVPLPSSRHIGGADKERHNVRRAVRGRGGGRTLGGRGVEESYSSQSRVPRPVPFDPITAAVAVDGRTADRRRARARARGSLIAPSFPVGRPRFVLFCFCLPPVRVSRVPPFTPVSRRQTFALIASAR